MTNEEIQKINDEFLAVLNDEKNPRVREFCEAYTNLTRTLMGLKPKQKDKEKHEDINTSNERNRSHPHLDT